MLFKATKL